MNLLPETLTESASIHGAKTALIFKDESLSYNQLNQISNKLASLLKENGVGTNDRIGIFIDKSIESIVALFGILKSGACYVPLDPLAPPARQNLIINDCVLKYLVTSSVKLRQLTTIVKQSPGLQVLFILDKTRKEISLEIPGITLYFKDDIENQLADSVSPSQLNPENLAYILYTSGSTGQPKGVMLSHRAGLAFVDWSQKTFNLTSDDMASSHAPLHFDLSIFDIFVSIKAGATINLVPQGWKAFPRSIADFIEQNKISTWYSVPSALIQLVLHGDLAKRRFPALKRILFAGEVFPSKYLARLMKLIPDAAFYNLYGPTETNVITCFHVQEPPASDTTIPIGALCDNVKSFIVSESGNLVDSGKTGEMYVECPTLMNGYWNDNKKTQRVLNKNPFEPSSKNMIYKTGDLVRCDKNGLYNYHGRCDAMIKSRGYRIELGDIETVLSVHPKLKEAAVIAVPNDEVGNSIKAVVVPSVNEQVSEKDIQFFCSKKLPGYMVPEIISFVPALPRTSTGKIDRKKLPDLTV